MFKGQRVRYSESLIGTCIPENRARVRIKRGIILSLDDTTSARVQWNNGDVVCELLGDIASAEKAGSLFDVAEVRR